MQTPQTAAGLNLASGGTAKTVILQSASGPMSQPDASLGSAASLRWPFFGNQCALVNQAGANQNVNSLSQTATISNSDVDPLDGRLHVRFLLAPVLANPSHTPSQQPYVFVQVLNLTRSNVMYSRQLVSAVVDGLPWKSVNTGTSNEIDYTDWQLIDATGDSSVLQAGDMVQVSVYASGCQPGSHFGEAYVDQVSPVPPGSFVTGMAVQYPDPDGAHEDITYTITYRNSGTSDQGSAVCDFTTPLNTVFASVSPPPGATVTTPAIGSTGTVNVALGTLAAGTNGSFKVTVQAPASAVAPVQAFNYEIHSSSQVVLLGPAITPSVLAPLAVTSTTFANGTFTLGFTNTPGFSFNVLRSNALTVPASQWPVIGTTTESPAGTYHFSDPVGPNSPPFFYRVRFSP